MGFLTGFATGYLGSELKGYENERAMKAKVALENLRSSNELNNWRVRDGDEREFRSQERKQASADAMRQYKQKSEWDEKVLQEQESRYADNFAGSAIGLFGLQDTPAVRDTLRNGYISKNFNLGTIHTWLQDNNITPDGKITRRDLTTYDPPGSPVRFQTNGGEVLNAIPVVSRPKLANGVYGPPSVKWYDASTNKEVYGRSLLRDEGNRISNLVKNRYGDDALKLVMNDQNKKSLMQFKMSGSFARMQNDIEATASVYYATGKVATQEEALQKAIQEVEPKYGIQILSNPNAQVAKAPIWKADFDSAYTIQDRNQRAEVVSSVAQRLNNNKPIPFARNPETGQQQLDYSQITPQAAEFIKAVTAKENQLKAAQQPAPGTGPQRTPQPAPPQINPKASAVTPNAEEDKLAYDPSMVGKTINLQDVVRKRQQDQISAAEKESEQYSLPKVSPKNNAKQASSKLTMNDLTKSDPDLPAEAKQILGQLGNAPIPDHVDTAEELAAWLALAAGSMGLAGAAIPVTKHMRAVIEQRKLDNYTDTVKKNSKVQEIKNKPPVDLGEVPEVSKPVQVGEPTPTGNNPNVKGKFGKRVGRVSTTATGEMVPPMEGDISVTADDAAMKIPRNMRSAEVEHIKLLGLVNQPNKKQQLTDRVASLKSKLQSPNTDEVAVAKLVLNKISEDPWFQEIDTSIPEPKVKNPLDNTGKALDIASQEADQKAGEKGSRLMRFLTNLGKRAIK